jgi:hypothetical protein
VNTLVEEHHMKWRFGTTAPVNSSSRAASRDLWRIMTSIRGSSWPLIFMLAHRSLTWESTMAPSARRSIMLKCSFTSFLLYVIQLFLHRAYL